MDVQRDTDRIRTFGGYGADTDIIVASAKAYLAALNKLLIVTRAQENAANSELALTAYLSRQTLHDLETTNSV